MRKDPTEFRKRFADWKAGKKVYDGGLPAYQKGKEGKTYIGGTTNEARNKYWNYDTELSLMTDSVANQYGINPKLLKNRLDNEGFTDFAINNSNSGGPIGAKLFNGKTKTGVGFKLFGADDAATYINEGKTKLINESWGDASDVNENGRTTYSADGVTYGDNIGITAAVLKYMRDEAKKNMPGSSDEFLDNAAATYYTRGIAGGQKFIQNGGKDPKTQVHTIKNLVPAMLKKPQPYKTTADWNNLPHFDKGTWGDEQDAVLVWGESWKERTQPAAKSKVVLKWNATGKKPAPESSEEYTKRRVAEETKRTWLSDAADIAEGIKEGAAAMTPYTATPYFGAKVGQAILNGNVDASTALDVAFAAAPFAPKFTIPKSVSDGINKFVRSTKKGIRRLTLKIDFLSPLDKPFDESLVLTKYTTPNSWTDVIANLQARKTASKHPILPSKEDKILFLRAWDISKRSRYGLPESVEEATLGLLFGSNKDKARFINLINRNPEYYEFIRREGITDPMSQESVSKFLDNLFTSVRGVVAKDAESAKPMLQNTELFRDMSGGDRLGTNGGLYTSNSTTIADRFKNPGGTKVGNGYVAKVRYPHNISTDMPLEDQLEQYRKMVLLSDRRNPLYGTPYFEKLRQDPNVIALESNYVGNASSGASVLERAYLPASNTTKPTKAVDILNVQEFLNLTDQHGRWLSSAEEGSKSGLFIPRQMNDYSDFVRSAKTVLKPKFNRDMWEKEFLSTKEQLDAQSRKRSELLYELLDKRRDIKNNIGKAVIGGTSAPMIGGFVYGIGKGIKEQQDFFNSPEYQRFLNDPNYDKYKNLNDGSFTKLSSLNKLENKYESVYKYRRDGKPIPKYLKEYAE